MIGQLDAMGIGRSDDPATMCAAAMLRTAVTMRPVVASCAARLHSARKQHSALRALGDPMSYADRREWQALAVSDLLSAAARLWDVSEQAHAEASEQASSRKFYRAAWQATHTPPPEIALLPRLRHWFSVGHASDQALSRWGAQAVASVAQASPVFGLSLLRLWCDAWATSQRRGHVVECCIICGRC